jgi:hypothetical protein
MRVPPPAREASKGRTRVQGCVLSGARLQKRVRRRSPGLPRQVNHVPGGSTLAFDACRCVAAAAAAAALALALHARLWRGRHLGVHRRLVRRDAEVQQAARQQCACRACGLTGTGDDKWATLHSCLCAQRDREGRVAGRTWQLVAQRQVCRVRQDCVGVERLAGPAAHPAVSKATPTGHEGKGQGGTKLTNRSPAAHGRPSLRPGSPH